MGEVMGAPDASPPHITLRDGRQACVRSVEVQDAAAFVEHRLLTCTETDFLAYGRDEVDLTTEREEAIIREIQADASRGILVAILDGRLVGFAGFSPVAHGAKFRHRASMAISVERAAWGLGIGTALMSALIDGVCSAGFEQLELGVYAENVRARRLYDRLGFVEWGVLPNALRHADGTRHDEVQMYLAL